MLGAVGWRRRGADLGSGWSVGSANDQCPLVETIATLMTHSKLLRLALGTSGQREWPASTLLRKRGRAGRGDGRWKVVAQPERRGLNAIKIVVVLEGRWVCGNWLCASTQHPGPTTSSVHCHLPLPTTHFQFPFQFKFHHWCQRFSVNI